MSDTALKNAEKRLDSLAAEINRLVQAMEEVKRQHAATAKWIEDWHAFAGEVASRLDNVPVPKTRTTGNPSKEVVVEKARELIQARGEPLSRDNLYAGLEADGIKIQGADPKMVLSTMLWRMKDRIVRVQTPSGYRYWLADQPNAVIGYAPPPSSNVPKEAPARSEPRIRPRPLSRPQTSLDSAPNLRLPSYT